MRGVPRAQTKVLTPLTLPQSLLPLTLHHYTINTPPYTLPITHSAPIRRQGNGSALYLPILFSPVHSSSPLSITTLLSFYPYVVSSPPISKSQSVPYPCVHPFSTSETSHLPSYSSSPVSTLGQAQDTPHPSLLFTPQLPILNALPQDHPIYPPFPSRLRTNHHPRSSPQHPIMTPPTPPYSSSLPPTPASYHATSPRLLTTPAQPVLLHSPAPPSLMTVPQASHPFNSQGHGLPYVSIGD